MKLRHRIATLLSVVALCVGATAADAQRDATGPTPPRVALVDGVVTFWRPGAEDWTPAKTNTALAEGDELYVADRGNVELQIGSRAFVRAGADTQIGLEGLDAGSMQFKVTGGHAAFDLRRLPSRNVIEIDTPRAAFTVDRPGYYRVDVEEARTTFSARRGGSASLVAENGEQHEVGPDQQLVLSDDNPTFGVTAVAALDDWDRWNDERTASFGETPRSAQYVSQEVAGVDDLDRYGEWHDEPRYGRVWRPRDVGPDWSPYSTGRWQYDPYYEWTWVDDAPWGWAPYHYGRWVYANSYWGWAPGPVVVQPAYAPALVAFFGAPGVSVSVNVGVPFVSWCPLGWGEPVIPWWGGSQWAGRPYWGGWGGPRVVNNVVINNNRYYGGSYGAGRIDRYQNAMVHNAVVGLDRDRFRGGGRPMRLREARDLRPLRGDLGVRPVAHSFVPHDGRGNRPPERLQNRAVVATRAARDPMHRLRAQGIDVASNQAARPNQRIVHPRGGADRMASRGRALDATPNGFGAENGRGGHRFRDDAGRANVNRFDRNAPRANARERGRDFAPPPPRGQGGQALGHAAPARPGPQRNVDRGRERMAQPTPAPRMGFQNEPRNARRAEAPARTPARTPSRANDSWAHRAEPNPRREAPRAERRGFEAPAPRAERPRFEHQQRAPQERSAWRSNAPQREVRRAPAPDMSRQRSARFEGGGRGMQNQPRMERAPQVRRQAPRMEPQAERGGQRPHGGGGRGHQRDG